MKITLVEIPNGGLLLKESLDESWLCEALHLDEDSIIKPDGKLFIDLKLEKFKRRVSVRGHISMNYKYTCSRCLKPFSGRVNLSIKENFLPADKYKMHDGKTIDLGDGDFRYLFYEDEELDLGGYFAESLLLSLPMYPVCDSYECKTGSIDHLEDWGENETANTETQKPINPAWKKGLAKLSINSDSNESSLNSKGKKK